MTDKVQDSSKRPPPSPTPGEDPRTSPDSSGESPRATPPAEQHGSELARPRKRPKYVGNTPPTNNQ